jgi:NADH:ubiquinone oxidoreductase subunit 2 (subunit N)
MIQTEVFPLTMFAIGGMMLFPAADDLLTMFVALEVSRCRCTCCAGWPAGAGCCPRKPR